MILQNKSLKQTIHQYSGDLIFYFYWGNRPSGIIAGLAKYKDPAIVKFHGSDLYREMRINHGYIPFQKMVVDKASQIICISDHGMKYIRDSYLKLKKQIDVFRLGTIDHGISTGKPGNKLKVVSCSVIDANKRVIMIAEALQDLNIEIEWTHIGDGPLMQELERELAAKMNSKLSVNLPGKILNEQVHEIYKNEYFDLFINLSASEGVPFSIMEALSYSIPVIATAVGGVPELIDDSCGRLVDKELDIEAVKMFISYFNELNSAEKAVYRSNSRKRWEQLCNAEKNYDEFVTFLKKI